MPPSPANIPHTSHILDTVYVGSAKAAYMQDELIAANITHILKLYEERPYWPQPPFTVCDNQLPDGQFIPIEILQKGVQFIQLHVNQGENVLVLCGAGMSRSVTFILAYMLEKGMDLRQAWKLIRNQHPPSQPAREMWQSLITHYQQPYNDIEAMRWYFE